MQALVHASHVADSMPSSAGGHRPAAAGVRREFKPALERAKLPSFRFHDLRHYAVSSLIAQGADIKLLQAIAGHATAI
ncbi:MAG TPA: tyrosine-type recombinase/integrase [Gaiellaceae bacterium]